MHIGVTGPRRLTPAEQKQAVRDLIQLLNSSTTLHAGDATGLDALARKLAENCTVCRYDAEGWKPWQLQKRSRCEFRKVCLLNRMIFPESMSA
jgi:hypothetical protein